MVRSKKERIDWYEIAFIPVEDLLPESTSLFKEDYYRIYPKVRNLLLNTQVKVINSMMHVLARGVIRYEVRSDNLQLVAAKVCPEVMIYELSFLTEEGKGIFKNNRVYGLISDERELENEVYDVVTTFASDFRIPDREVAEFLKGLHELVSEQ